MSGCRVKVIFSLLVRQTCRSSLFFLLLLPFELICLEQSKGSPLPNFVLIVVDDAGLMDFGGYGGEVSTPHITALGDAGVRFSNYHTSPLCAPTRAMLLTGVDNHLTGVGTIPEVVTPEQKQTRGYSCLLYTSDAADE